MIIKKFTGKTQQAAEAEALRKLGEKAIFLHNRQISSSEEEDSYEVTAAIEEPEKSLYSPKDYSLEDIEKIIDNLDLGMISPIEDPTQKQTKKTTKHSEPSFSHLCTSLWKELSKENSSPFDDLIHNLSHATKPFWQPKNFIITSYGLKNFLIERGIDNEIADALMKKVGQQFESLDFLQPTQERDEAIRFLYKELTDSLHIFGPIIFDKTDTKVIALVGPSGTGKSTVAAKLAYQYARQLKKRVMIITLEKQTDLKSYKKVPQQLDEKISLKTASTKEELEQILRENYRDHDLIIIDSFNCSLHSWEEMDKLMKFFELPYSIEVHLVVSALIKDADAMKIFQHYSPLTPASFIVTKIKETVQPGLPVNMCVNWNLPISYLTSDANIDVPLEIAEASSLARQLLLAPLK